MSRRAAWLSVAAVLVTLLVYTVVWVIEHRPHIEVYTG